MDPLKAKTATVITAHQANDELPLTLAPGDTVIVDRVDPERPGWVWATDGSISAGWVPIGVLESPCGKTRATAEFCSTEISVEPGDVVRLMWQGPGGWWCENRDGDRGWLPENKLKIGDGT